MSIAFVNNFLLDLLIFFVALFSNIFQNKLDCNFNNTSVQRVLSPSGVSRGFLHKQYAQEIKMLININFLKFHVSSHFLQ